MTKICFLNGSPRFKNSTSGFFCNIIKELLTGEYELCEIHIASLTTPEKLSNAFNTLSEVDTVLLALPLYIDSLPAHLISFLQDWEVYNKTHFTESNLPQTTFFSLTNNGFIEGDQNHIALDMLQVFCDKIQFTWGLGLGVGGGEFMKASHQSMPLKAKVKLEIYNALVLLSNQLVSPTLDNPAHLLVSPTMPKRTFQGVASISWVPMAMKKGCPVHKLWDKALIEK